MFFVFLLTGFLMAAAALPSLNLDFFFFPFLFSRPQERPARTLDGLVVYSLPGQFKTPFLSHDRFVVFH